MSLLEKAIQIAVRAHAGQKDRAGQPYILHPLRVMARVHTEAEKIVAILHDTVEDTDLSLDDLRAAGFPEEILIAVDCLTKREGEPYDDLIQRAKLNRLAKPVKLADLQDNMDIRRNARITAKDLERFDRYLCAWKTLSTEDGIAR
jgi:(p)ppGpp synthase/HD superfamily hydrolase